MNKAKLIPRSILIFKNGKSEPLIFRKRTSETVDPTLELKVSEIFEENKDDSHRTRVLFSKLNSHHISTERDHSPTYE